MYRLAYVSTARDAVRATDLQDILEAAIRNNAKAGVTGTLLFNGVSFLQILEGPEKKVEEVFNRICTDTRHHHIMTIYQESGTRRSFDDNPMSVKTVKSDAGTMPDGLTLSSDLDLFLPSNLPDHFRKILKSFNTIRL